MEQHISQAPYGYCQCGCGKKTPVIRGVNKGRNEIKGTHARFCNGHGERRKKGESLEDVLWSRVKRASDDYCWEWEWGTDHGYGALRYNYKKYRAHRLAYEFAVGPIIDGLDVLHKCDNRRCCRPDHLFLGTNIDNVKDKCAKDRQNRGSNHGSAILDEPAVTSIRQMVESGMSQTEAGLKFGVSNKVVWNIVHRTTWKHIS